MSTMTVNNKSIHMSYEARLSDNALTYSIPIVDMSSMNLVNDVRAYLSAILGDDYHRLSFSGGRLYYSWQKENTKIRIKTHNYTTLTSRSAQKYREVAFDDEGKLDLIDLVEKAKLLVQLDKEMEKDKKKRRDEMEERRKLKERTLRFIGATDDYYRPRGRVVIEGFDYDPKRPDRSVLKVEITGDPKKLKRAINALAKLGAVRGRKQ